MRCLNHGGICCDTGVLGGMFTLDGFDPIKHIPNGCHLTGFFSNFPTHEAWTTSLPSWWSFGTLEATRLSESPKMADCWQARDFTAFGGENEAQMIVRIRKTFDGIVGHCCDGEQVLVVAHRGYFYYLLAALFGWSMDELFAGDPMSLRISSPTHRSRALPTTARGIWTSCQPFSLWR